MRRDIHVAAGVWAKENKVCYFKRSTNGLWELPWQPHEPRFLDDPQKIRRAELVMQQLANERFYGTAITVGEFICEGMSENDPSGSKTHVRLYYIEFKKTPILNRSFYTDLAWMTADDLLTANAEKQTGFETRMWLDEIAKKK